MKICTKCNKEKSLNQFHISKIFADGHNNWCKDCMRIYHKKYRKINKQKIKIQNKIYRELNKDRIIKYKEINKDKIRKRERIYLKNRRMSNIGYRLEKNLRKRIWDALKGNSKSKSTMKLLGCSLGFFRLYLQSKFQSGMSFKNYGKWHIDHIRPCAKFNLSIPEEQAKCFHYTNLQPLWAKDNRIKSDSLKLIK